MKSAAQLLVARLPSQGISPKVEGAVDHEEEPCAICAGPSTEGVPVSDFIGVSLTDQNTFRAPASPHVCCACAFVRKRFAQVPGRVPGPCDVCGGTGVHAAGARQRKDKTQRTPGEPCSKCEGTGKKESAGRFGNFSHFCDDDRTENASKGEKSKILWWLRGAKRGEWFCCVADSGQKHLLPYTPVNPAVSRGRVLFEEQTVALPDAAGWAVVDDCVALLTAGATKEEVLGGRYSARAWQFCGERLGAFEARWSRLRGGAWFALVVWLAQRDEAGARARLDAEKGTKEAKRKRHGDERKTTRTAAKPRGRNAPRVP